MLNRGVEKMRSLCIFKMKTLCLSLPNFFFSFHKLIYILLYWEQLWLGEFHFPCRIWEEISIIQVCLSLQECTLKNYHHTILEKPQKRPRRHKYISFLCHRNEALKATNKLLVNDVDMPLHYMTGLKYSWFLQSLKNSE